MLKKIIKKLELNLKKRNLDDNEFMQQQKKFNEMSFNQYMTLLRALSKKYNLNYSNLASEMYSTAIHTILVLYYVLAYKYYNSIDDTYNISLFIIDRIDL